MTERKEGWYWVKLDNMFPEYLWEPAYYAGGEFSVGDRFVSPFEIGPRIPSPDEPLSEPVAWMYQHEETGLTGFIDVWEAEGSFFENNPRLQRICPVYRHPSSDYLRDESK